MHGTFLPNTLITRIIQIEHLQGIIIPIQDTGHADDPINIDTVVGDVQLFQGFLLVLFAGEQEGFCYALWVRDMGTIMPFVPIWLFYRFRYFKVSQFWSEFPIFYALDSPSEFP